MERMPYSKILVVNPGNAGSPGSKGVHTRVTTPTATSRCL